MTAVVTGGAGFIGSHLSERLVGEGWSVIAVDDLSSGLETNLPPNVDFVRGDAGDSALMDRILPGSDAIFHLAAVSSVQDSIARPLDVHAVNLTMTLALLEGAVRHGIPRFVFSSSAAVYGDTHGEAAREDMKPHPLSHYAVQKLASEHYCAVYRRLRGLQTFCLRYFNVYGPRQRDDSPYSGVTSKFLAAARKGEPLTICGDGGQARDFVHVSDVAAANLAASRLAPNAGDSGIFNIGSGSAVTINELARLVGDMADPGDLPPVHSASRVGEIRHSVADISRAGAVLGFSPRVKLSDGLDALVAHGR